MITFEYNKPQMVMRNNKKCGMMVDKVWPISEPYLKKFYPHVNDF